MNRTLYVFKTSKGFLTEECTTTSDPFKAITFVDFDTACKHLLAASGVCSDPVQVEEIQAVFPKPFQQ
jgi:hypothetical protein